MKIGIACDHNGYVKKEKIKLYLIKKGYDVIDYGCDNGNFVDYPKFAFKLGKDIDKIDFGILICKTGIGMSIAANKIFKVRCACVRNIEDCKMSRLHNNANVMAISSKSSLKKLIKMIKVFINTEFSNEERHIRRVKMIDDFEMSK